MSYRYNLGPVSQDYRTVTLTKVYPDGWGGYNAGNGRAVSASVIDADRFEKNYEAAVKQDSKDNTKKVLLGTTIGTALAGLGTMLLFKKPLKSLETALGACCGLGAGALVGELFSSTKNEDKLCEEFLERKSCFLNAAPYGKKNASDVNFGSSLNNTVSLGNENVEKTEKKSNTGKILIGLGAAVALGAFILSRGKSHPNMPKGSVITPEPVGNAGRASGVGKPNINEAPHSIKPDADLGKNAAGGEFLDDMANVNERNIGLFDDATNMNRGTYGQDIYNPAEPMNQFDPTSPYYNLSQFNNM